MRRPRTAALAAALVLVLMLLAGFALGRATSPGSTSDAAPAVGTGLDAPGAADVGFAQDMAVHHEQAVLMADLAMTRATPTVRAIAESILTTQSQEVGLLRGWLRLWSVPAVDPTPMAWMGMTAAHSSTRPGDTQAMPGMATSPQLDRLYRLGGRRFDVLFLQLMIRHHQGGLIMAHAGQEDATLPQVRQAAQTFTTEQVEDLGSMRALLRADGGRQLPLPG